MLYSALLTLAVEVKREDEDVTEVGAADMVIWDKVGRPMMMMMGKDNTYLRCG